MIFSLVYGRGKNNLIEDLTRKVNITFYLSTFDGYLVFIPAKIKTIYKKSKSTWDLDGDNHLRELALNENKNN